MHHLFMLLIRPAPPIVENARRTKYNQATIAVLPAIMLAAG